MRVRPLGLRTLNSFYWFCTELYKAIVLIFRPEISNYLPEGGALHVQAGWKFLDKTQLPTSIFINIQMLIDIENLNLAFSFCYTQSALKKFLWFCGLIFLINNSWRYSLYTNEYVSLKLYFFMLLIYVKENQRKVQKETMKHVKDNSSVSKERRVFLWKLLQKIYGR
jgi:hypothetical protein